MYSNSLTSLSPYNYVLQLAKIEWPIMLCSLVTSLVYCRNILAILLPLPKASFLCWLS